MPELPEVEVLASYLQRLLPRKTIRAVRLHRPKVLAPTAPRAFARALQGATFTRVERRGKYLLFGLAASRGSRELKLLGHLGMTGRMYLLPFRTALPKHAAVVLDFTTERFVYEDTRYFGRLTLDTRPVESLGPEPLGPDFSLAYFRRALQRSRQAIKVKLLDQRLVAGIGNIYASEALFRARVSPKLPSRDLTEAQARRLHTAIRRVLRQAIAAGSTMPLNHTGLGKRDGLFYFGRAPGAPDYYRERLQVYDRAGQPCRVCRSLIARLVQAARSTYYCPRCQPEGARAAAAKLTGAKRLATTVGLRH